jgi:hypothetical protein
MTLKLIPLWRESTLGRLASIKISWSESDTNLETVKSQNQAL